MAHEYDDVGKLLESTDDAETRIQQNDMVLKKLVKTHLDDNLCKTGTGEFAGLHVAYNDIGEIVWLCRDCLTQAKQKLTKRDVEQQLTPPNGKLHKRF
eukprot:TRINITY_DN9083_c0_g1_i1.p1 TRINITY_DN9083_c0_g1~~TRINITY_DN9083_c0_g1_i1.p1  ORF type:complete len:98 (+),score=18.03 TRINITY_DN9083_c0_g1_i1:186-479(+)